MSNTQLTNNAGQTRAAFAQQVQNGLEAIGMTAERYAKIDTPVDTGRLRNSISHDHDNKSVVIGTNVEYAPIIELKEMAHSTGKAHFLRDAAAQHGDEYKRIMKASLNS